MLQEHRFVASSKPLSDAVSTQFTNHILRIEYHLFFHLLALASEIVIALSFLTQSRARKKHKRSHKLMVYYWRSRIDVQHTPGFRKKRNVLIRHGVLYHDINF